VKRLKEVNNQALAQKLFQNIIPEAMIDSLSPGRFAEIRSHLLKANGKPQALITLCDLKAAVMIFALVFLTTFPVVQPFFIDSVQPTLRLSNLIALLLLFGVGFSLGRYADRRPFIWGIAMTAMGTTLVGTAIALGG
jgi:VIT1/CCC1 family predicted Fe2+/Mn2+ transporter